MIVYGMMGSITLSLVAIVERLWPSLPIYCSSSVTRIAIQLVARPLRSTVLSSSLARALLYVALVGSSSFAFIENPLDYNSCS